MPGRRVTSIAEDPDLEVFQDFDVQDPEDTARDTCTINFHAAGHDSKGALHASRSSLAVIPPVGSHELLAADPSAVSTKQPAQQSELVFRGPHAWKHVAFRCSTAPRKASEWQSRRIRLTTAFSRQWQPAVGAAPLHSPLAGIENHIPWSLSAAAAVAHAPIFDGPDP